MEQFSTHTQAILDRMNSVIDGKPTETRTALTVLLAGGHLLVEDVPGVGKTMLARTLAGAIGGTVSRIQFTPDLLPTDITGVSVYDQVRREFEFKPGPVFANLVIGDEINRASAKTQSALLEAMAESQVTADGTTYQLSIPFMVVATQNPVEMDGTFPLPEAQRDRFTARISMGYPDADAEVHMLAGHGSGSPLKDLQPVLDIHQATQLVDYVRSLHVSTAVRRYIVSLCQATRTCAWGPAPAPHFSCRPQRAPRPPWPAAIMCSRTTSRPSPCPYSPTGYCSSAAPAPTAPRTWCAPSSMTCASPPRTAPDLDEQHRLHCRGAG